MAKPNTRQDFINYCLRELGAPVIEINVDVDQIEDRVDDALQIFHTYHFDGVERIYFPHEITQQNVDDGFITLDPSIITVVKVFPYDTSLSANNLFSIRYQMAMNDFWDISNVQMSYYAQSMQTINFINSMLNNEKSLNFNRVTNRVIIDTNWEDKFSVGQFLMFEVYIIVNPSEFGSVWNNEFLKKYGTALIKKQWGNNTKKFSGVQLPGGVTLNGQQIFDEAIEELKQLDQELQLKYQIPPRFFIG